MTGRGTRRPAVYLYDPLGRMVLRGNVLYVSIAGRLVESHSDAREVVVYPGCGRFHIYAFYDNMVIAETADEVAVERVEENER